MEASKVIARVRMMRFLHPISSGLPAVRQIGPRVYLHPPQERDWRQWTDLRAASRSFLEPWEPTWTRDALARSVYRERLRRTRQEWHDDTGYAFHVFRRKGDVLLGGVTLSHVRRGVAQAADLGYWIGQPHARHGYMTESLRCVMAFAFDELRLHRLEAACLPNNEASKGLLRKLGFREEGYAVKYLRINGVWHDHLLFAILCEEAVKAS